MVNQRKKERKEAKQAGNKKEKEPDNDKRAKQLEKKIAELTEKRDALENEIANEATKGGHGLKDMNILHQQVLKDMADAENEWIGLLESPKLK